MSDLLNQRITEVVESMGYHVFDIQWTRQGNNRVLQVACGKDDFSMDLDGCTIVSDAISTLLDNEFETELDISLISSVSLEYKFDKKGRQKSLKRTIKLRKDDKNDRY